MTFSGVHLTFGRFSPNGSYIKNSGKLLCDAMSSQTMATPGTSTIAASSVGPSDTPILSISASSPIFFVTGPNPDINHGVRRYFSTASWREDYGVAPGDRVAWTNASVNGVHIEWGYIRNFGAPYNPLYSFEAIQTETIDAPGLSSTSAPSLRGIGARPVLTVDAANPIFYATGSNPDINVGPRKYYNPQTTPSKDDAIFVNPGDKFVWTLA